MYVSTNNDRIIIKGEFSSNYHSQLLFYGFKKNENLYEKTSASVEEDVLKILDYFNFKNIDCKISEEVEVYVRQKQAKEEEWSLTLSKANAIKSGKFERGELSNFLEYLNTIPRTLRDHQVKAAFHLYTIKNGANFSVPGSGKTTVVLSVYEKLKRENECNVLFVVGPPSSFQPWINEFRSTLGREADFQILSGGYSSLRKNEYYSSIENCSEIYLTTFHTN